MYSYKIYSSKQYERNLKMTNTNFVLSCCSTVDLTEPKLKERNIEYIPMHYFIDGVEYRDDLGKTISSADFYARMVAGADTKTSQVNTAEFIEHFEGFLSQGKDILHLSLSSGISGTYRSACIAADELKEKYPERKIIIVDTLGASSGYGLLVDIVADMRDEGKTIEEAYEWAMENRLNIHHWFFSTDLTFFVKGGRVSKVSGWFGTALKICPLLNVSREGKLIPREKIRTKQRVINAIVDKMLVHAKDGENYSGKCYISHSDRIDDANIVKKLVEEKFKNVKCVEIYNIGTVIGSHSGPGTVALFFEGTKRAD